MKLGDLQVSLREAQIGDDTFLRELYAGTRRAEVSAFSWTAEQTGAFLRMQYDLQKRSYLLQYPSAIHRIVLVEETCVGRIITAVEEAAVRLVDISLLPAYRNQGLGTKLVGEVQREAAQAGKAVHLHVLQNNPARHLYERLGFTIRGENHPYTEMQWNPAPSPFSVGQRDDLGK